MKKAHMLTVAVLLAALAVVLIRKTNWRVPEPAAGQIESQGPQDTIYSMLNAARAGNVKAYLANYTGQTEAALRQTLVESKEPEFAKYLRDSSSSLKGVAVSEPQTITDQEAKVRVEYVYQDRNEVQMMYLEKRPSGWKISRTDGDERVETLVPYGTPVK
jgi:hypothetical protein